MHPLNYIRSKLVAALVVLAVIFSVSPPADAVEVHAWNTTPQTPYDWVGTPVGQTTYTTGAWTNATLTATCLLKWTPSVAAYTHDGCDSFFYDYDWRGNDQCNYNPKLGLTQQWFVTEAWLTIHHWWGDETVVLYSAPAYLVCTYWDWY